MILLETLPARTGIHTFEVAVPGDRIRRLGCDLTGVERLLTSWTALHMIDGAGPGFCQIRSLPSADDEVRLLLLVDTLLGPRHHGCCAVNEAEIGAGKKFEVVLPTSLLGKGARSSLVLGAIRIVPRGRYGRDLPTTALIDVGNSRTSVAILDSGHGEVDLRKHFSLVDLGRFGNVEGKLADSWFQLSFPSWQSDFWIPKPGAAGGLRPRKAKPPYLTHSIEDPLYERWILFQDPSRARLGRRRIGAPELSGASGLSTTNMSSPKRYIWSTSSSNVYWFGVNHGAVPPRSEYLRGEVLRFLVSSRQAIGYPFLCSHPPCPNFSRSQMTVVFLFEILSQVFHSLNSSEFQRSRGDQFCRYLDRVVLTFPAAMPMREVTLYQSRVESALSALYELVLSRYDFRKPALVNSALDEASASQIAFVFSKVRQGRQHWTEWVATIAGSGGESLSVGCLDIGGGSVDASIIRYQVEVSSSLLAVKANLLFLDGVSKGGDDLLLQIVEEVLIPGIADQVGVDEGRLHYFFEHGSARPEAESRPAFAKQMLREFLFPLAIHYIRIVEGLEPEGDFRVAGTPGLLANFLDDIQIALEAELPMLSGKIGDSEIPFDSASANGLVTSTLSVVGELAQRLRREGAQVILLAGRLSVLGAIRGLAKSGSQLPDLSIVQLHKTEDLRGLIGLAPPHLDWVLDPKLSVVFGAAIAEMARQNLSSEGVAFTISRDMVVQRGYYWGRVSASNRCFVAGEPLLFEPEVPGQRDQEEIIYRKISGRMLIGRRLSDDEEAEANVVYEIRPRREEESPEAAIEKVLGRNADEELELKTRGKGSKRSGERVELNLKTQYEEEYWLDRGLKHRPVRS